ncbi:hypothetical protein BJX66DRAFT_315707 [Aspergillus keveii]|uniref:Uncharacterized protein n=1 Tax=Aspergillus keveii TaxID=714993 RepID=A0ABR4FP46_9EURO
MRWTDEVLMLAMYDILPAKLIQHLTAGAKDAQSRATAASTERLTQAQDRARVQLLHYFIPAQYLGRLWERIQFYLQRGQHTDFQGCRILITAKDLKMQFSGPQWPRMWNQFFQAWDRAVDRSFLQEDFYDVAKEIIALKRSFSFAQEIAADRLPLTLTWR